MSHGSLNFELNVGASFSVSFTWLFPNNPDDPDSDFDTPQDLTGWTGQMQGPPLDGFPLDLTLGCSTGTVEGMILDTSTWTAGTYDYQIEMIAPDNTVDVILVGKICVDSVPQFP